MTEMQDSSVLEPARFAPTAEDRRRLRHLSPVGERADGPSAQLIAAASVVSIAKDEEFLREGMRPSALLTVLSGRVALVAKSAPGHCAIVDLLGPGSMIMPATVLDAAPYPLSAIAFEATRIANIPIDTIRAAVRQDPGLAELLMQSAATDWRRAIGQLRDQRLLSAPQRFAAYLLQLTDTRRGKASFEIGEDRKTLASLLGMTPENLSRTIGQFRALGVTLNGRHVDIADVAVVAAFAQNHQAKRHGEGRN